MGRGGSPEEGDIKVNGGAWRRARDWVRMRGERGGAIICVRERSIVRELGLREYT